MAEPIQIFNLLLIFFGMVYIVIIVIYTIGWFKLRTFYPGNEIKKTQVSIIVPARNEAKNISLLLQALYEQDYPIENFEVIVVDDNSTDQTAEIVNAFIKQHTDFYIKIIQLTGKSKEASYKKKAITQAVESSLGELIITTDADCFVNKNWLRSFVSFYQSEKSQMIVGPVCFHKGFSFFEKLQSFEFLSLIAITAGAIRIRRPIMCNGANLAYEKSAFMAVGGFGNDKFSSGDDVFLLLKIKQHFGNESVRFLKTLDAIVYTEPKKNMKDFIQQRVRWASKNKGYDAKILLVSFTVYIVNLLLIIGLALSQVYPSLFKIILLAMFIKMIIDLPILFGITKFVNQMKIMFYAIPMIILYPIYIIITGALGIIGNYQWKGRKIRN
jgi:cellulose synthase/poly-beta-1,6-N-acetylglucosamine synthase-like glycosyltransferase